MVGVAASGLQITAARPSIFFTHSIFKSAVANVLVKSNESSWVKLANSRHVSSVKHFQQNFKSNSASFKNFATKAKTEVSENRPASVLPIDLRG